MPAIQPLRTNLYKESNGECQTVTVDAACEFETCRYRTGKTGECSLLKIQGGPLSFEEIAQLEGITKNGVNKVLETGLIKLRRLKAAHIMRE